MARYDAVVAGLGAMGAATALALARNGASVLGLDAHRPPHELGSSHGGTRITRRSVAEGDAYVPLVARSHERWRELEAELDRELFVECGLLVLGDAEGGSHHGRVDFASATKAVAVRHGIDHELLGPDDVRARFPAIDPPDREAYFEPGGGYLRTEDCVDAMLAGARARGAELHFDESLVSWRSTSRGCRVSTTVGEYEATRLVICAGPWVAELVEPLSSTFSVQRQVAHWLSVADVSAFGALAALPAYLWFHGPGDEDWFYGFPAVDGPDGGVKVATERFGRPTSPSTVARSVAASAVLEVVEHHVDGRLRGIEPSAVRSSVCMYTVTRDFGFVLDELPGASSVLVVSACSGHGFKHAPAVGECAAALALGSRPEFDVSPFALSRFG